MNKIEWTDEKVLDLANYIEQKYNKEGYSVGEALNNYANEKGLTFSQIKNAWQRRAKDLVRLDPPPLMRKK